MAIYIENTLNNAKSEQVRHRSMRNRDSIRVAKLMKKLVLKFSVKQNAWKSRGESFMEQDHAETIIVNDSDDVCLDADFAITREVFFFAIQDPEVQDLMDDLDMPPERASLFDVIDANGNGELKPTELVNGLLKVRGDSSRSDSVASLLAVRALQQNFLAFESIVLENQKRLYRHLSTSLASKGD